LRIDTHRFPASVPFLKQCTRTCNLQGGNQKPETAADETEFMRVDRKGFF